MPSATQGPIGRGLERRRLEHRERRIVLVLAALRASERQRGDGGAPPPLRQAIRDFGDELTKVRRQLGRDQSSRGRASASSWATPRASGTTEVTSASANAASAETIAAAPTRPAVAASTASKAPRRSVRA